MVFLQKKPSILIPKVVWLIIFIVLSIGEFGYIMHILCVLIQPIYQQYWRTMCSIVIASEIVEIGSPQPFKN